MIENRIKDYRSDRGMTQTELAKLVGVRRETIYNLENGKYKAIPYKKTCQIPPSVI